MIKYLKDKYIKPKSLTWLSSMAPLLCGIVIATEPMHGMSGLVQSIGNATGLTAPELIVAGLGGVGLRGAMK